MAEKEQGNKRPPVPSGESSIATKKIKAVLSASPSQIPRAPARPQALPTVVVKREPLGVRRGDGEEEREGGEVGQDAGAEAVTAMEAVVEAPAPQLSNLRMGLALFHCRACLLPLKPPTFKCEAGHIVCGTCRESHRQACGGGGGAAATYAACAEVDAFVGDAKQPCAFQEHGCVSYVVYHQASDHARACQWAPCHCPDPGCRFLASPPRLLEHFRAAHTSWPVTAVAYGKAAVIPLPAAPRVPHVLAGEGGRCVFLVTTSSALGPSTLVSVVCVRANAEAAAGVGQYKCMLWAEDPRGGAAATLVVPMVESTNLSGGFPVVEECLFMVVPAKMVLDASGEAPVLKVRIDRVGGAAANATPTSAARSSGRQRQVTASA